MKTILLSTALIFVVCFTALLVVAPAATTAMAAEQVQDGSLIFWRGGVLAGPIARHTGSNITHAAIVLKDTAGKPWVYEAVPPRVHKVPLSEYLTEMTQKSKKHKDFTWFVLTPKKAYTQKQVKDMRAYAEEQLGRPYMLRGWWKGHEVRGLFCSQYVGNILEKSGVIKSGQWHESPASLHKKIQPLYKK